MRREAGGAGRPTHPSEERALRIIDDCLKMREQKLGYRGMRSDAMFPPFRSDGESVRQQSMSRYEKHVEQAIGETLMLRDGRRSHGQRMLDRGVPIGYVSHCMGHDPVETAQKFHADHRDRMVLGEVRNILNNSDDQAIIGKL